MNRYHLHVHAAPAAGQETLFHDWYDQVHVPEMLAVDGVVAAQRFAPTEAGRPFLTVYEVEAETPANVLERVFAAAPGFNMSPSLDQSTVAMAIYSAHGARREKA